MNKYASNNFFNKIKKAKITSIYPLKITTIQKKNKKQKNLDGD